MSPEDSETWDRTELPFKHEVRLGWGGFPLVHTLYLGCGCLDPGWRGNLASDLYGQYNGPVYMTGNIFLEYSYSFKKWLSLSADIGMNGIYSRKYDKVTGRVDGLDFGASVTIVPHIRFSYLNRQYVKLYSSVGLGITVFSFQGNPEALPAIDLVPIGISAGRKVYGFFELGIGTVILGCSAGIGIRF